MRQIKLTDHVLYWVCSDYPAFLSRKNRRGNSIMDKEIEALAKLKHSIAGKSVEINLGGKNTPRWTPRLTSTYVAYIEGIENRLKVLYVLKPSDFNGQVAFFEGLIPRDEISLPIKINGVESGSFSEKIVKALCYKDIRDSVAPRFFKTLNIRTCVYCNANYAITDTDGNAYYDLDHWKPKALYPYLSASFFNFQPSCPSCNRRKSDRDNDVNRGEVYFHIWEETESSPEVLRFELSPLSLTKYLVYHHAEDLSVSIQDAQNTRYGNLLCKTAEDTFHINGRYHEHNDYLEEIIWKSQAYNANGMKALEKILGNVIPKYVDPLRFILGNYTAPADIHKRPLAKLTQDVAKQLGLL